MLLKLRGPVPVEETTTYCVIFELSPSLTNTRRNSELGDIDASGAIPAPVNWHDCVPESRPSVTSRNVPLRGPFVIGAN